MSPHTPCKQTHSACKKTKTNQNKSTDNIRFSLASGNPPDESHDVRQPVPRGLQERVVKWRPLTQPTLLGLGERVVGIHKQRAVDHVCVHLCDLDHHGLKES